MVIDNTGQVLNEGYELDPEFSPEITNLALKKWDLGNISGNSLIKILISTLSCWFFRGSLSVLGYHILELGIGVETGQEGFQEVAIDPVCLCPFHDR